MEKIINDLRCLEQWLKDDGITYGARICTESIKRLKDLMENEPNDKGGEGGRQNVRG